MSTIIPKKWELLPVNHPTLLRRLVRELNSSVSGIYASGHRYSRARLHDGQIQVRASRFDPWEVMGFDQFFSDGNGNHICGSRTRCGH